jgi:prepilin-type N-terminal cleavage/methylation domain-containing protein
MKKAFTLVETMICLVIGGLLLAMAIPACDKIAHRKDDYAAWCKLNHRTDITYAEWQRLFSAGLLNQPTIK